MVYYLSYRPECPEVADFCDFSLTHSNYPYNNILSFFCTLRKNVLMMWSAEPLHTMSFGHFLRRLEAENYPQILCITFKNSCSTFRLKGLKNELIQVCGAVSIDRVPMGLIHLKCHKNKPRSLLNLDITTNF